MTTWVSRPEDPPGQMLERPDPPMDWATRWFQDLLHELCPDGLTDDCPARRDER